MLAGGRNSRCNPLDEAPFQLFPLCQLLFGEAPAYNNNHFATESTNEPNDGYAKHVR